MKDLHLPDVLGHTTDEAIRRLQAAGAVCKVAFTSSKKGIIDPDGDRVLQIRQNGNEVTLVAAAVRTEPKESGD
ncbi:MAG: hypothetical protein ACOYIR_01945 [Christensenellales bacterium]|jgi:hypothetical protein